MQCGQEQGVAARFEIFTRCHNCRLKNAKLLSVPEEDEAPTDVESLLESAFLQRQAFRCDRCEHPIGTIIAVNPVDLVS